jgi:excisionase family DNA binding protein
VKPDDGGVDAPVAAATAPARKRSRQADEPSFQQMIRDAMRQVLREELNIQHLTGRRLLSVKEAAQYLNLSEREIYNMITTRELAGVKHGSRKMVDIRDADEWIEQNKI